MGHPKCLGRAIGRTVCTCRIVIGRMPSSESRLKRYLMTTFRKTMDVLVRNQSKHRGKTEPLWEGPCTRVEAMGDVGPCT